MNLPTIYQAKNQIDVITIEPGDPDEAAAQLLQEHPNLRSRNCNTRCVELIWRRDEFRLRALNVQFPVVQAEQSLVKYVTDRRQTLNLVSLYRNLEGQPAAIGHSPRCKSKDYADYLQTTCCGASESMSNNCLKSQMPLSDGAGEVQYGKETRLFLCLIALTPYGTRDSASWETCLLELQMATRCCAPLRTLELRERTRTILAASIFR